ncbi:hypothetical protein LINGRAHAP2_LOCUS2162 [Linum grandiflorum]
MADLWHPGHGVLIEQLENQLVLCLFRHLFDNKRVLAEGPWHFDISLLILKEIPSGRDPQEILLRSADFWIQVNDVPDQFHTPAIGKIIGDSVGQFISYDETNAVAHAPLFAFKPKMVEPLVHPIPTKLTLFTI